MFDQLFEGFRKASESSLEAQQEMFKQWVLQLPAAPLNAARVSGDKSVAFQKRWTEVATEALNRHRELLDATYKSGIELIEQAIHVTDAKSPDDFRRLLDELWRKLSDIVKERSESHFRELQKFTDRWLEMIHQFPAPT
jgi:hypothetical protein